MTTPNIQVPFVPSYGGAYFTELAETQTRSFVRKCAACQAPLADKGYHQRGPGKSITFWMVRCTKCRAPHIVFNTTK